MIAPINGKNYEPDDLFDGVEQAKKRAYLMAFSEMGSVCRSAKAAGITRVTAWNWEQVEGPEGDAYRKALAVARRLASEALETEARRRAVEGLRRLRFDKGVPIIDPETGEPYIEHEYSDLLLIFLMKGAMPEKYRERASIEHSGPGGGPIEIIEAVVTNREQAIDLLPRLSSTN